MLVDDRCIFVDHESDYTTPFDLAASPDSQRHHQSLQRVQMRGQTGAVLRVSHEQGPPAVGHHHQSAGRSRPNYCTLIQNVQEGCGVNVWLFYGLMFKTALTPECLISGHHDEHLPSVHGGRINGEEVRRQH